MAGFLYFFPGMTIGDGKSDNERKLFADLGLPELQDGESLSRSDSNFPGPGGLNGTLVGVEPGCPSMRHKPEEQQWLDCKGVWIGWEKADLPAPADLVRKEILNGHAVKLGDGKEWIVPCLPAMPRGFAMKDDGTAEMRLEAAYQQYREIGDGIIEGNWPTFLESFKIGTRLLQLNYRLPARACFMDALNLLNSRNLIPILEAMIDYPTILAAIEAQKKTA